MGGTKDEEFQKGNYKFEEEGEFDDDGKPKRTGNFI